MSKIKNSLQYDQVPETTKQKTDNNIISLDTNKSKVKKLIRDKYEIDIDPEEFEESYKYANHKLNWQEKHFNKKFNLDYRAKVTIEIYRQRITTARMELLAMGRL